MRIPKGDRNTDGPSRTKGYGYVEFEDRESLLDALVLRDTVSFYSIFKFLVIIHQNSQ